MPEQKSLNERDSKLVQWLNEAHTKEAELAADLTAHIALTDKQSYKKRLRQHLTETKAHKRSVAARIKQLGGSASAGPTLPGVPSAVGEAAGKAVAAVKGQVGAARAAVTSQPETHLRNAQEELREEHVANHPRKPRAIECQVEPHIKSSRTQLRAKCAALLASLPNTPRLLLFASSVDVYKRVSGRTIDETSNSCATYIPTT